MDITPEQSLTTFPEIRTARTVENTLYLVALLLWVVHSLGLYRALHRRSPGPALFGAVLSIVGLTMLIAGALPHVATAPLSDLYHASGATPQAQATLLLVWHGIHAVFEALLVTGLFIVPMGLIAFGRAMFGAPDFGARLGSATVGLGLAGLAAACTLLVQDSLIAAVGVVRPHRLPFHSGPQDHQAGRVAYSEDGRRRMTGTRRASGQTLFVGAAVGAKRLPCFFPQRTLRPSPQ